MNNIGLVLAFVFMMAVSYSFEVTSTSIDNTISYDAGRGKATCCPSFPLIANIANINQFTVKITKDGVDIPVNETIPGEYDAEIIFKTWNTQGEIVSPTVFEAENQ